MNTRMARPLLAMALAAVVACGCGRVAAPQPGAPHHHEHHPPHGGTPVVLGDEAYHIELVLDPQAGLLQAYILDGEMENFIRCDAPSIEVDATVGGKPEKVLLGAVANPATGETVGDTALFEGRADWLRGASQFDGVLRSVTIRGTVFAGVKFNFPKGNDTDG